MWQEPVLSYCHVCRICPAPSQTAETVLGTAPSSPDPAMSEPGGEQSHEDAPESCSQEEIHGCNGKLPLHAPLLCATVTPEPQPDMAFADFCTPLDPLSFLPFLLLLILHFLSFFPHFPAPFYSSSLFFGGTGRKGLAQRRNCADKSINSSEEEPSQQAPKSSREMSLPWGNLCMEG